MRPEVKELLDDDQVVAPFSASDGELVAHALYAQNVLLRALVLTLQPEPVLPATTPERLERPQVGDAVVVDTSHGVGGGGGPEIGEVIAVLGPRYGHAHDVDRTVYVVLHAGATDPSEWYAEDLTVKGSE